VIPFTLVYIDEHIILVCVVSYWS